MRLTTTNQVVKFSTRTCHRTACNKKGAIHFNQHTNAYYCHDCMDLIEEMGDIKLLRPMVDCNNCDTGHLRFIAPHAATCDTCYKKTNLPSHTLLVKEETQEAVLKISEDIEALSNIYKREPTQWRKVMTIVRELEQEVMKL